MIDNAPVSVPAVPVMSGSIHVSISGDAADATQLFPVGTVLPAKLSIGASIQPASSSFFRVFFSNQQALIPAGDVVFSAPAGATDVVVNFDVDEEGGVTVGVLSGSDNVSLASLNISAAV
jgi:hypothetical protein